MDIFVIDKGIIKPTDFVLGISPFKEIWDRDKSDKKDRAIKDFTFIEYYVSPKTINPFKDIREEEREKKIIETVSILKGYKPDKLVWQAVDRYKEMLYQWSKSYRLYTAAMKAIENLRDFLETVDVSEKNDKGMPIYKPKDITNALKDINSIISNLKDLERNIFDEISSAKIYGGKRKNPFEDPNMQGF